MNFIKPEEMDVQERPFKIYWHNRFLRSYITCEDLENGLKFFNQFLIAITTNVS